jgi:LysM repeat protein
MLAESVRFDDESRPSHSDQPVPPGGVLKALREAAEMSGLDPQAELYNEALRYATEGHLRMARERLNVLLGINPEDGQARLLLAKVHVAGQRWQEALAALDEAATCGEHVPMDLRRAVEDNLRADTGTDDENTASMRARELGEIKALRQEARRLRSENAQLVGRCHDLERETRKWAWTTTAVSVVGLLFVAGNLVVSLVSGGDEVAAAAPVVAEAPAAVEGEAAAAAAAPEAEKPVPTTPTALADAARQALETASGLDGTELAVTVRGTSATLQGEVLTAKQKKRAEAVLGSVKGISAVNASGVKILARTQGAEHVVGKGDTLSKIALLYYGESSLAPKIQKANEAVLKGKTDLSIGQKLTIPKVD